VSETIKIQPNLKPKPKNAAVISPPLSDRKIDEITAGLAASCAKNLRLLSKQENIFTIIEYIQALKIETSLSDHYKKDNIELLTRFSNFHCSLVRLSDRNNQNESWYCNRCSIEYPDVTNIRHQLKITVPDRNIEPAVTSIQINMADEVEIRHTPPLRGGFAELQKKGLKIKNYHTTEKE
jgi:hypothetical protein